MTTLPLTDHPIVREAAEGMAREVIREWTDEYGDYEPCIGTLTEVHARLLCDLKRTASMDHWSRWGMNHAIRAAGDEAYRDPGLVPDIMRKWNDLRNDRDGLASAILATLTPATR